MQTWCINILIVIFYLVPINAYYKYTLEHGQRIQSEASKLHTYYKKDMTAIMCATLCGESCQSFHFSNSLDICETFEDRHFDPVVLASDTGWTIGYRQQVSVVEGEWTLAFRAQKAIGIATYDTWVNDSKVDDNPILSTFPNACLRFSDYSSCDRHFRSHILNNWTNIDEVRFSLYKSDAEVAFITFNGVGSDRESWFSYDRILNSTWAPAILEHSDIHVESMSVQGFGYRRFYIAIHVHCAEDSFYTMTNDLSYDYCSDDGYWDITWDSLPTFLYSPGPESSAPFNQAPYPHSEFADVAAVWVKFLP